MTLRGELRDFPLRVVLDLLGKQKKTGELQLRAGDRLGALGLADGRVIAAVFADEEPLLALAAVFDLEEAEFEFTPWNEAPPANLSGSLDELLKQAADARRRIEEARRKAEEEAEAERKRIAELRAVIPNDRVKFRLSEHAVDQGAVTLTSERWRVVLAVNGDRDVTEIAAQLRMDTIAALTALAGLVRDGVIDPIIPTEEPATPPAAPPVVEESKSFAREPEGAPPAPPAAAEEWITPAEAAPAPDWASPAPTTEAAAPTPAWEVPPSEPAPRWEPPPVTQWEEPAQPTSQHAPQWTEPTPEPAAPTEGWRAPSSDVTAPSDDRLSALTGIFTAKPTDVPPAPAAPSTDWGTPAPSGDRWRTPEARPAPDQDPWGAPVSSAPPHVTPEPSPPSASGQVPDSWGSPATESGWTAPTPPPAPAAPAREADPWGAPAGDARSSMAIPEPGTPPVEEWSPPPAAAPEKKKGLFGWARPKLGPPAAGQPLPSAGVVGSKTGMLAALANTLIGEYNSGQYGKGRIDERMANLLMRVDEQADPIDRPLPIVDDRIDVQALEREKVAEQQAVPYLALLVSTIFADAEKTFGKDKAKKGYKAATKNVLLGDASALQTPELAGKLPKV